MSLADRANKAKDVPDPQTQPDGNYKLVIKKAEEGESGEKSKNPGAKFTRVYYGFDKPAKSPAALLSDIFMDDTSLYDEDIALNMDLRLKHFMLAFQLTAKDLVVANFPNLKGKTGWASVKEVDDPEYGLQNQIKDYVTGE